MNIIWLGQGGFLLQSGSYRLAVDPYLSDAVFKAEHLARLHPFPIPLEDLRPDAVLVTHDHMDHLDPEGIPLIRAAYPACRFAGPERSFSHFARLGIPENLLALEKQRQRNMLGPFEILPVFAAHSDPSSCGYVLRCEDKKIYLTGDTRFDRRLFSPATRNADLLLICINGKLNNMNTEEALACVRELGPATALPMHIGLFAENTADPAPFVEQCRKFGVSSFAMTPGKEFTL